MYFFQSLLGLFLDILVRSLIYLMQYTTTYGKHFAGRLLQLCRSILAENGGPSSNSGAQGV